MNRVIIILTLFSLYAAAQDTASLKQQFDLANKLYVQGKFFDAVTEYERLLCFDTLHTLSFEADKSIASCYRKGGQFKNAITYAGASLVYAKTRDEIFDTKIELVKLHILNHTFSSAINILSTIEKDSVYAFHVQHVHYWRGWVYMFSNEWGKAADEFAFIDSAKTLRQFCIDTGDKFYPVTALQILSAVVPGSGQMLTGHVWNGLLSLGWNALWGYLTIDAAVANRVGDALLIGDLLWLRFYTGSISNTKNFADEKNSQLFQDALRYLQDEFIGAKP
jgi:tetratricopeptide (TPR) repeat protein